MTIPLPGLGTLRECYLARDGHLYARFSDRIVIIENATTAPKLKAHLTGLAQTHDIIVLE